MTKAIDLVPRVIILPTILLAILSCVSIDKQTESGIDLENIEVSPLSCIDIELRESIIIEKEIIHESSIANNRYLVVLTYNEENDSGQLHNIKDASSKRIFFVNELEQIDNHTTIVHDQHFIIEIWKSYQDQSKKTCHQWYIGSTNASLKLIIEKASGTFVSERIISLNDEERATLQAFYYDLKYRFLSTSETKQEVFELEIL
jgi:hypothetical protein